MGPVGWLIVALSALAGLYLFLIAPRTFRRKASPAWFRGYFAHRGLHGQNAPENSLQAFRLAAEHGFGVELDVRLTLDGRLAVHHDETLLRTCGLDRRIADMTLAEIHEFRLMVTSQTVPGFEEVLREIGGRTPLIVELKSAGKRNGKLAEQVYRLVKPFAGMVCVESFDPRLLRWFRRHAPEIFRGQLAYDPVRKGEKRGLRYKIGAHLMLNFLSRPDFVAYDHETDRNPSFRLMRALFHPPVAAWTVRSENTMKNLQGCYDVQIFEGFLPEQPFPND